MEGNLVEAHGELVKAIGSTVDGSCGSYRGTKIIPKAGNFPLLPWKLPLLPWKLPSTCSLICFHGSFYLLPPKQPTNNNAVGGSQWKMVVEVNGSIYMKVIIGGRKWK